METRDSRLEEIKAMLLSRNYNRNVIDSAFTGVKSLDRLDVLKQVEKKKCDRVTLTITYHPKLPTIP